MHAGIPRYGLSIKREKTRVNFDVEVDGIAVTKLPLVADFPYCGNAINTVDLHIKKDEARRERNNIAMAITVEGSKTPGQNFFRKTLNMLKVHMHAMHLCTSHNGLDVVLSNLYSAFFDTAERCIRYIQSLPNEKKPSESLIIRTIEGLVDVAFGLMQRKKVTAASSTIRYQCSVTRTQTKWLAARAFSQTFQVRQTRFIGLLLWLDRQSAEAEQALIG
ncbi:hypothetical protein AAFC00_007230 [Neodothiora populina]|uniref:Telomerase reverse transcriptase n=1 Tax=Neodothiora populina TaxID=2781224 RepID=A0ABR3PHN9_9PEZI